jgi:ATP-dependent Clp protease adaptor protein ClpS
MNGKDGRCFASIAVQINWRQPLSIDQRTRQAEALCEGSTYPRLWLANWEEIPEILRFAQDENFVMGGWQLEIGNATQRFELRAAYVSIFFMSAEPLAAEVAVPLVAIDICPESAAPSTIGAPTIEKEAREKEALDVPWQVVVHNDPVNLMSYVTMVFQRVFGYPRDKAEKHMLEVHQKGRSILWSGMRERAELYVQQLHGYLLLATLEKIS